MFTGQQYWLLSPQSPWLRFNWGRGWKPGSDWVTRLIIWGKDPSNPRATYKAYTHRRCLEATLMWAWIEWIVGLFFFQSGHKTQPELIQTLLELCSGEAHVWSTIRRCLISRAKVSSECWWPQGEGDALLPLWHPHHDDRYMDQVRKFISHLQPVFYSHVPFFMCSNFYIIPVHATAQHTVQVHGDQPMTWPATWCLDSHNPTVYMSRWHLYVCGHLLIHSYILVMDSVPPKHEHPQC